MLKHRSRLIRGAGTVVTMAAIAVSGVATASAASAGSRPTDARAVNSLPRSACPPVRHRQPAATPRSHCGAGTVPIRPQAEVLP
jgi:hypothetical protein